MKTPVEKFTLALKVAWLNSCEKVVDDIDTVVGWVVEIVKDHNLAIRPKTCTLSCEPFDAIPSEFPSFERLPSYGMTSSSARHGLRDIADESTQIA